MSDAVRRPIPVYAINRAADTARRARFEAEARALGHDPRRIEAVDGEDLAALRAHAGLLAPAFWESAEIKPGAFACFLSHRRAWAAVAVGDAPWALVCEDDAPPCAPPAALARETARAAARAGGLDLLFCGGRLQAWREAARPAEGDGPEATRLAAALAGMTRAGLPRAPGAEANLISRRGARRLLALTGESGCCAGVDWLALFFCAGSEAAAATEELASLSRMLGRPRPRLRAGLSDKVLAWITGAPSVLDHGRRTPLSALREEGARKRACPVAPPDGAGYTPLQGTRSSAG